MAVAAAGAWRRPLKPIAAPASRARWGFLLLEGPSKAATASDGVAAAGRAGSAAKGRS